MFAPLLIVFKYLSPGNKQKEDRMIFIYIDVISAISKLSKISILSTSSKKSAISVACYRIPSIIDYKYLIMCCKDIPGPDSY